MMEACAGYPSRYGQSHAQELAVLGSISRLLASRGGQRELLSAVLEELERKLGMIRGTVMLRSPDGDELSVEVARNLPAGGHKELRYRGEGILGAVLQSGQPAFVPRVSKEPRFTNRIHQRPLEEAEDVSFLCVPIVLEKEIVGTLSVDLPVQRPEILREQSRLLEIIAAMIAFDVHTRRMETARQQTLEAENLRLRRDLEERFRPENIVGNSHAMRNVYTRIHQVARSNTTALLRGEAGTGKELVAAAIHYSSPRAAAADRSTAPQEREPAGRRAVRLRESRPARRPPRPHRRGPRRHALPRRNRRFLPRPAGQAPPPPARTGIRALGGNQTRQADVRVIAATQCDLEACVAAGTLRQDLYYRIHVFPIALPPLHQRARRHPPAGRPPGRQVCEETGQGSPPHQHARHQHDAGLPLAGQRPRVGELHRARVSALHRRRHPRPYAAADAATARGRRGRRRRARCGPASRSSKGTCSWTP